VSQLTDTLSDSLGKGRLSVWINGRSMQVSAARDIDPDAIPFEIERGRGAEGEKAFGDARQCLANRAQWHHTHSKR
jgi:hypothetical protein